MVQPVTVEIIKKKYFLTIKIFFHHDNKHKKNNIHYNKSTPKIMRVLKVLFWRYIK